MRRRGGSLRLPVSATVATATSTICLGPTFLRGTWFLPAVVAIVVVAATAELTRRYSTSRAAAPVAAALALTVYLVLRYARDEAYLGIVPTVASLDRLGTLAASGRDDIARYAAPIGVSPGIELLTVAGVGLVALAVDSIAVTWRRAALAGLPLLVLFLVPTAVVADGVHWLSFAIGAGGYLALLLAEARERVSRWGRPMTHISPRANWTPQVETAPLGQVGRRVGATALGLALVVPAVVPDLTSAGFGFGSGAFGTGGDGDNQVRVDPVLDLGESLRRPSNQVVIAYRGRPTYLRMVGLDLAGTTWAPRTLEVSREDSNVEDGLVTPPGLAGDVTRTDRRYRIRVFNLKQSWLPLPYPAARVSDIEGTWLYDRDTFNVFGENTSTLDLSYRVRALAVTPTAEQLRAAPAAPPSMRRYLRLPSNLPSVVRQQAVSVAGGLPTSYDQALALQDWLRSDEFTYSTEIAVGDRSDTDAIRDFLETKQGYCIHFATTMALMARQLGIPARVAVGFTAGTPDGSGTWAVGLHDAHSWPELYFQGVGWVAFEPTPGVRTGAPPPWARSAPAGPDGSPSPTASPTSTNDAPGSPRVRERTDIPGFLNPPNPGGGGGIPAGPVRIPVVPLLVGLGLVVLFSVPGVLRVAVRRRRWRGPATPAQEARAAWADLQDTLLDFGHRWRASDSPRAGVARLVAERRLPAEAAEAAHRLAGATERARYAPSITDVGDLRADVATVWRGLAAVSGRWTRWRAVLLPRSTRAVATAVGERTADVLDAVDTVFAGVGERFGRQLRPRRN